MRHLRLTPEQRAYALERASRNIKQAAEWHDPLKDGGERMKNAIEMIQDERKRQIEKEAWSTEHDDKHVNGELAAAAAAYALHGNKRDFRTYNDPRITDTVSSEFWPFEREWFKPSPDPVKNLVRAGALIVAELERIQRRQEIIAHPSRRGARY